MKDPTTANREAIHNDDRNKPPEQNPKPRRRLTSNAEVQAMDKIDKILSDLGSDEAVQRTLNWVNAAWAPAKPLPEKQRKPDACE